MSQQLPHSCCQGGCDETRARSSPVSSKDRHCISLSCYGICTAYASPETSQNYCRFLRNYNIKSLQCASAHPPAHFASPRVRADAAHGEFRYYTGPSAAIEWLKPGGCDTEMHLPTHYMRGSRTQAPNVSCRCWQRQLSSR